MIEIRPDFLNLRLWAPELAAMLAPVAHSLTDNFGNVLTSRSPDDATDEAVISLRGKPVAKVSAAPGEGARLRAMLEGVLEAEYRALEAANALEASSLLDRDLDAILDLSESEAVPLEELVHHALRLLRAHVWVERASVFGMLDGFTLEGIAGIGRDAEGGHGNGAGAWRSLYSSCAGLAATSRKPYLVEDPANDPHFQGRAGAEEVRNVISYPLLHGKTLVGVMNLTNRVGGAFTERDVLLVRRFASLAAHLLQKHVFKTRMLEFEAATTKLGKFVSKNVAEDVERTQDILLGGVEKKVVCLFCDIRGYTSITEGISPGTLVGLLNFHFDRMHEIIEGQHNGTIDKIVGDLIMAVWNFPKDQPDPELLAMKCALAMQKEFIRVVGPEWKRHGVDKVGMGIGVNSGNAIVGKLGSQRFMNFTVIGDAVNTAQRLEAKARAGEIWMNEEMFPLVHGKLEKPVRRELDIRLKGKEQVINAMVYKPLQY